MNARSLKAALVIVSVSLTACQTGHTDNSTERRVGSGSIPWVPTLTPDEVKAISPDEAKAVLLARSVIEENAKKAGRAAPEILHFYPKATEDGWDVHVEYVAFWTNGKPYSGAGFFSDVRIGRNWKVIQVIGGA